MVSTTSGKANVAVMNLGALETIVIIGTFWFALSASLASAQAGPVLTPKQLIDRSDVYCVHHDDVGFVWLCTDDGIVRFDGEKAVTFGAGTKGLRALVRGSGDRFWVGGTSGLYEFDLNGVNAPEKALVRISDSDLGSVNALVKLGDGIACATDDGAVRLLTESSLKSLWGSLHCHRIASSMGL